jgi:WD40 repeat protein
VFRFDRTLIQPTPEALVQALSEAAAAANFGGRGLLLRWPASSLAAFLARWRAGREGWWQWNGGEEVEPPRAGRRHRPGRGHGRVPRPAGDGRQPTRPSHERRQRERRSVVATVWWSDWIGRRHQRVVGCQRQGAVEPPETLLCPGPLQPPAALVYPEHSFRVTRRGETRVLVAYACGVFGTPEEVGWMGGRCGPCHDRREAEGDTGESPTRVLTGSGAAVGSLAFSADGRRLAAGGLDNLIQVWDVATGRRCLVTRARGNEMCSAVCLSPDGTTVAARTGPGTVSLWDLATGGRRAIEAGAPVWSVVYTPDGLLIASSPWHLSIWDAEAGRCEGELSTGDESPFDRVTVTADGSPLVIQAAGGEVIFRDARGGQECRRLRWPGPGDALGQVLAVSPDGRTLVVGPPYPGHGFINLWDTARGTVRRAAYGCPPAVVLFAPDGRTLVTAGSAERAVKNWNAATGAERVTLEEFSRGLTCAALSPDGRTLATGNAEGGVKLWPADVLGGSGSGSLDSHPHGTGFVEFPQRNDADW